MTIDRSTLTSQRILDKYIYPKIAFEPNTGCWVWLGHLHRAGYGSVQLPHIDKLKWTTQSVARVVYENVVGPIPADMLIKNQCKLQCCVNPDHHLAITSEVWRRKKTSWKHLANRTKCNSGHDFDDENTFFNRRGQKKCRICQDAYEKKHHEKKRAEDWRKFGEFLESGDPSKQFSLGPKKYYVYHLIDPFTESVFYVGKGCGSRVLHHERDLQAGGLSSNPKKEAMIRSIWSQGGEVNFSIVHRHLTEAQALWLEQQEINRIGYDCLTNRSSVAIPRKYKQQIYA